MNDNPKSGGERHIEKIMQELEPESERYQVLDTAKRFKSSWVELGEKLLKVSSTARFSEWGYGSFEEYCVQEIRIKKGLRTSSLWPTVIWNIRNPNYWSDANN